MIFTITLLCCLGVAPLFLVAQIYVLGREMSEPERMVRSLPGLTPQQNDMISPYDAWLSQQKLEYRTTFKFGKIQVVVFQHENRPRFFSFLFHQRLTFSAESYLEDMMILDTGSSGSQGLFPRPGAYAQSFPNLQPQFVWQKHLEGEAYLMQKFGYRWMPMDRPYEEILVDAMRIRMKHNRSQSLWPFRVLYRYFVTRHQLVNRTIAQQFP